MKPLTEDGTDRVRELLGNKSGSDARLLEQSLSKIRAICDAADPASATELADGLQACLG